MNNNIPLYPISTDAAVVNSKPQHGSCHSDHSIKRTNLVFIIIVICLSLLVLTILVMAAVPPVSRDALTHHLAVPKMWIEHGGIYEIPQVSFSYFPMNLDLLYVVPLLYGNDIAAKFIHFSFGMGTALLIFTYLRKRSSVVYALLGALVFLSTPVIVRLSISVYVDLGLIFFSWASMYCIFQWLQSAMQLRHLVMAAICCGLAMGTKYNGLLVFFLLSLSVPLIYKRTLKTAQALRATTAVVPALVFVVVALVVFSPWMVRNISWTGNPIYPLYKNVFSDESDENPGQQVGMKPWLLRKLIYRETAIETALIPIRIFFQGQDDNPKNFDGRLNPILFFFPMLAFIKFGKQDAHTRSELIVMGGFSILYLFYASFMVDMRIRYIAPILPPLVILSVLGIKNAFSFVENRKIFFRMALVSIISVLILLNGVYVKNLFVTVAPIAYLNGSITREDYIEKFRPEYPVVQVANHLPDDKVKLLALFLGNRRYYFNKDVEFATEIFKNTTDMSAQAEDMATALSNRGFTHVIVGVSLFKNWAKSVFNNEKLTMINQFFSAHSQFIDAKNGYALFAIRKPIDP